MFIPVTKCTMSILCTVNYENWITCALPREINWKTSARGNTTSSHLAHNPPAAPTPSIGQHRSREKTLCRCLPCPPMETSGSYCCHLLSNFDWVDPWLQRHPAPARIHLRRESAPIMRTNKQPGALRYKRRCISVPGSLLHILYFV